MRFVSATFFAAVLVACSSSTVEIEQVDNALASQQTEALENFSTYRLDYLHEGGIFSYFTFEVTGKYRYFELLSENGQVVAASEIGKGQHYWPRLRECTLFPHRDNLDVSACFARFNAKTIEATDPDLLQKLNGTNDELSGQFQQEAVGTSIFAALLSPLLIPATLISSPMMIYDSMSAQKKRGAFRLALGPNDDLEGYLKSLAPNNVSKNGNAGSAYLASGILGEPALAFGFIGNQIIWIQRNPRWSCGGGFMFWGNTCTVGSHGEAN
ncbi:hypothetical protein I6N98_06560 [Spongiibacter nanhainus]|uniref:Uncharacterized protein n=1 Tax=Spongiibacter nanhainus TaxID=2794344 RepID=A0A7T4URG6_9GAMM|nr:hypothetical protein [Spongiibacter nanhainus]QQD19507.1 hypothetical protein I6N98_06560 [Spongiibacter nanhainus]